MIQMHLWHWSPSFVWQSKGTCWCNYCSKWCALFTDIWGAMQQLLDIGKLRRW